MTAQSSLLAAETASTFYQFARLQAMSQWWHWLVLVAVCAAVLAYVVGMYRKDSVELSRGLSWALVALRLLAFASVLFYFFNLEKRTERQLVKKQPRRAAGRHQSEHGPARRAGARRLGRQDSHPAGGGRIGQRPVARTAPPAARGGRLPIRPNVAADGGGFVCQTRRGRAGAAAVSAEEAYRQSLREARRAAVAAGAILFVGVFLVLVFAIVVRRSRDPERGSWTLPAGVFALILGLVVLAVGNLRNPDIKFLVMIGWKTPVAPDLTADRTAEDRPAADKSREPQDVDWEQELAARGLQTRLGDAVRYLVNKERGGPIAGLVVFTDGRRNEGVEHTAAASLARLAEIAIYPVGLGSDRRPANIRVVDLEAPERVYPGDRFTLTGYVQANGMPGRSVEVRLTSAPTGVPDREKSETVEQEDRVELGGEGEIVAVKFEVTPDEAGRRTYQLAIKNADARQQPQGRLQNGQRRSRGPQDARPADRGRSVPRISVPAEHAVSRQGHRLRRLAADGRPGHLAGSGRGAVPVPRNGGRAVRVRLHRGLRSRLDAAGPAADQELGAMGRRQGGRVDRRRRARPYAAVGERPPGRFAAGHDPRVVSRRLLQQRAGHAWAWAALAAKSRGRCSSPAKAWKRSSCGWRTRP